MSKASVKMICGPPANRGDGALAIPGTPLTKKPSSTPVPNITPRNVRSGNLTKIPSLSSARKLTRSESNPKKRRGRPRKTPSPVPSKCKATKTENELSAALLVEKKESTDIISHSATKEGKSRMSQELDINEIISESNDLLRAAYEAQSLGRLSGAQSFLYLAHARLVGLGQYIESTSRVKQDAVCEEETTLGLNNCSPDAAQITSTLDYLKLPVTTPSPNLSNEVDEQNDSSEQLTDRLAYAAITLLHQRTGKGMQYEAELERKKSKQRKPMNQSFETTSHSLGFHLEKESNTKKSKIQSDKDEEVDAGGKKYEYERVYSDIRTMSNNCAKLNARMLLICPETSPEKGKDK